MRLNYCLNGACNDTPVSSMGLTRKLQGYVIAEDLKNARAARGYGQASDLYTFDTDTNAFFDQYYYGLPGDFNEDAAW